MPGEAAGERGEATARAALAGNPSDGYGGAVLATAVPQFTARAVARVAPAPEVRPPSALISAAIDRLAATAAARAAGTSVRWETSIPRGVGLGGSSALVIATLRATCALHRIRLDRDQMATMALAVETEDLGIAAGLQDRIAQCYGGVVFMDFAAGRYEPLDPNLMPPLVLGWRPETAAESGDTHAALRDRFHRGDRVVVSAMRELASAAEQARCALLAREQETLMEAVDASFELRRRMIALHPRHVEMVQIARGAGAAANYTGSGGAVVAVCRSREHAAAVVAALLAAGCRAMPLEAAVA